MTLSLLELLIAAKNKLWYLTFDSSQLVLMDFAPSLLLSFACFFLFFFMEKVDEALDSFQINGSFCSLTIKYQEMRLLLILSTYTWKKLKENVQIMAFSNINWVNLRKRKTFQVRSSLNLRKCVHL